MKPTFSLAHLRIVFAFVVATSPVFADEADYLLTHRTTQVSSLGNTGEIPGATTLPPRIGETPFKTLVSSLAIVLGGFLLLAALLRKQTQNSASISISASELMQTLGAVQVTPKVKLHLVRVGSRLLVLHLGDNSVERVAEIRDPHEVKELLGGEGDDYSKLESHPRVDEMLRSVVTSTGGVSA